MKTSSPSAAVRRHALPVLWTALVALAWCAAANVLGDRWWLLDLFSHFVRIWYWIAVAVFAAAFAVAAYREAAVAAALAAWFAWWLSMVDGAAVPDGQSFFLVKFDEAQWACVAAIVAVLAARKFIRHAGWLAAALAAAIFFGNLTPSGFPRAVPFMTYANVFYHNDRPEKVFELLTPAAELIGVVEENAGMRAILDREEWVMDRQREDALGAMSYGLYSREALASKETLVLGGYPVGHAVTKTGLHAYVAHPYPPMDGEKFARQKEVFARLAERLAAHDAAGEKFLLVGDFNSSVFSPTFRRSLGKWALRPAYSWNVGSFVSLPIDYAVTNLDAFAAYGPENSSDHVAVGVFLK